MGEGSDLDALRSMFDRAGVKYDVEEYAWGSDEPHVRRVKVSIGPWNRGSEFTFRDGALVGVEPETP